MEKNLEKLYCNVLFNFLKFKSLADVSPNSLLVSDVLKSCLSAAGFETDVHDFLSELDVQKGEL